MATPAERQALLFVSAVAALGILGRSVRTVRTAEPSGVSSAQALAIQIARVDSAVTVEGAPRRARAPRGAAPPRGDAAPEPARGIQRSTPAAQRRPVDIDRADSAALDSLPGIGPALASRIIADREQHGAFGSLAGLEQVRGIGPALAQRLAQHVTFSGPARPTAIPARPPRGARRP